MVVVQIWGSDRTGQSHPVSLKRSSAADHDVTLLLAERVIAPEGEEATSKRHSPLTRWLFFSCNSSGHGAASLHKAGVAIQSGYGGTGAVGDTMTSCNFGGTVLSWTLRREGEGISWALSPPRPWIPFLSTPGT